jgi:acetyl-CoA synthetase
MIFTSGTTAQPKGALLPHRVLPGRMPGFRAVHPGLAPGERFWSPADWAWIGGLYDSLFAPWAAGLEVVAYERHGAFDPARAHALLVEHGVQRAFLPPTALRLWMRSGAPAPKLASLHTAGEPLPPPVHAWAAEAFGTPPREVYGLTECAFLLVNEAGEAGWTGRPAPGHALALRDEQGTPCAPGEPGELCVRRDSPTMMLGYARAGALDLPLDEGWLRTGDLAVRDAQGRYTVLGRLDDVVKVNGYRVAPREVEAQLLRHPAVDECAVVGVEDADRGTVLKAFVRLAPGAPEGDLARELGAFVRDRLAAHEVPRQFAFVRELPTTTTGKVRRKELRGAPSEAGGLEQGRST